MIRGEFKKSIPADIGADRPFKEPQSMFQQEALEMGERLQHAQRDIPFAPEDVRAELADGVMRDHLNRAIDRSLKGTDAMPLPGGCFRINGPFLTWDPKPPKAKKPRR